MNSEEKEARKIYNSMAEDYHELRTKKYPRGWFYNEMLEMPAALSLLGNVRKKKILDFGCGTGIYAKKLTKEGAMVKGFDISPNMLKIAKEENPNLDLRVGSGYKIPFKEKFDIIIAPLVLDYFNNWGKVFRQVKKVLKNKGVFIFSVGNPVSECVKRVWFKNKKYRVLGINSYFVEKSHYVIWRYEDKKKNISVVNYHKTYETIIKTIIRNGFEIVDYKDTFPIYKSKKLFPRDYKTASKTPYFCVWKVKLK
jgi:SAM-dependent methyltransferase